MTDPYFSSCLLLLHFIVLHRCGFTEWVLSSLSSSFDFTLVKIREHGGKILGDDKSLNFNNQKKNENEI